MSGRRAVIRARPASQFAGLADDLDEVRRRQHRLQAAARHLVVVDQQDPLGLPRHRASSGGRSVSMISRTSRHRRLDRLLGVDRRGPPPTRAPTRPATSAPPRGTDGR